MIQREIERHVSSLMKEYPSVVMFGPRQCGKTTLAKKMFPDFSYANLEDMNVRALARDDPHEFFHHFPEPVIIDEIQRVPQLLSTVQVRIDRNGLRGQYLITGSQQVSLKGAVAQSLAGRTALVQMLPLSLAELSAAGIRLERDVQLVSGFMPYLFAESGHVPFQYYKDYVGTYLERDVMQMAAVHDLSRFEKFLQLLAGRTGQLVNNSALAGEVGVSSTTIGSWLSILEASHVVYCLRPWYKSRTSQVVKTPKVFFCDTGLAAYLLGIETPQQMMRDPLMGNLFENMVVLEALKTLLNCGRKPDLYFFRNSKGLEIDLLLLRHGRLHLFEIKSGKGLNAEFTKNMQAFSSSYRDLVAQDPARGTVIYSGETVSSYMDFHYCNYLQIGSLFRPAEETFALTF